MLQKQETDMLKTSFKGLTKGYWHGPCRTHGSLLAVCRGTQEAKHADHDSPSPPPSHAGL